MIKKLAPLTGVAFFVLLLVTALVPGNTPDGKASGAKVLSYYEAHRTSTEVSGLLTVIAVFVGVIFYGLLRDHLRLHEGSRGLTATAFGGVILFAASGALSAGVDWALTDSPKHLSDPAAQALNLVNMDGTYGLMLAGLAVLFFCFGLAIVRGKLLPAWLGWVAFPLALVALIPPIGFIAFIGAGIWTLVVSIAMWLQLARGGASVGATPATGS
jgi:hypothetical protein